MTSRNNILSYFLITIALLTGFSSCISVDEFTTSANVSGDIEFVVRPTSYNGQVVQTKATSANDFENKIHNCYLLLFNADGNRVYISGDLAGLTTYRIAKSEIINLLGANATCTACFIANVPVDIINGLTTLSAVSSTVLDINYSNVDVQDADNDNKHSAFVVPEFDLDGSGSNAPVQCLPMYGQETCNLATGDIFQISLKRLFAKVTINISVSSGSFDLKASHLFNLPTSVRLAESGEESEWIKDPSAFLSQQIEGPIDDDNIAGGISGIGTSDYEFYFYVPEYCLLPVASTTANFGNEKYKPQMFDPEKKPVLVRLFGTYDSSNITYDLYLGEDAATSFTLKRNVHYMNSMIINGITNSKDGSGETLDCRVEVTTEQFDEVEMLGQTANCYIIGQTGSYKYPACKGVFKGGVNNIPDYMKCTKGTDLKVLYSDNNSITLDNLQYNKEANEFSFDVTALDGGTAVLASNDGNVILGLVYNEDGQEKIEWSWHLWFQPGTSLDSDLGFFDFDASTQTYPNGSVLMDRNLGALPTSLEYPGVEIGAYYKYGHKEPFLGGAYQGGGESPSYDWSGDDKSVTDPCPPGYRVPASSVWSGNATHEHAEVDILGYGWTAYRYWNNGTDGVTGITDDVYFPYSGEIRGNQIVSVESKTYNRSSTKDKIIAYHDVDPTYGKEYKEGDSWLKSTYRNVTTNRIEYYNFSYTVSASTHVGALLQNQNNMLSYGGVKITKDDFKNSCKFNECKTKTWAKVVKEKKTGNFISGYTWITEETISETLIASEQTITSESDIQDPDWLTKLADDQCTVNAIQNDIIGILGGELHIAQHSYVQVNSSNGYQVRCVKE